MWTSSADFQIGRYNADGGPVVFVLPLHFAAQRRGLLDDAEIRHDRVEAKLGISGSGQTSCQFRVLAGLREGRIDQVHQFYGCHVGRIRHRRPVHWLTVQRRHRALPGRHRLNKSHSCASSRWVYVGHLPPVQAPKDFKNAGCHRRQVPHRIRPGMQDHESYISLRNILLVYHILIPRCHGVEAISRQGQERSVPVTVPTHLLGRTYLVPLQ